MLLSELPQEIIEKFAGFLSPEDKTSCSLVCKSWKGVFQDSMHSEIFIKYQDTLQRLVNSGQNNQHTYQQFGHLAQYLHIDIFLDMTDEELYVLQNTFPNIKYLYINNFLDPDNFGNTADWHRWRSLTELYIHFDDSSIPDADNALIKIILCLPLLRRLEIFHKRYQRIQTAFSIDDFESIHSNLKHLEHLKLRSNLLVLSETDLEHITKVSPAKNMGSLTITSEKTDHRWLCYFARKYPNLHTLDFNTSNRLIEIEKIKDDAIALFDKTPLPFQHLKKLNLEYNNCFGNEALYFWDMINSHKIPLIYISISIKVPFIHFNFPYNIDDIPQLVAELYLAKFSDTIKSFSVKSNERRMAPLDLMKVKDSLYNLVELNLKIVTAPIELDTLFDAAPHLKSVLLLFANVKVKDELYNTKRFGIQSFKIRSAEMTSDALRFLSFHCRSLNVLSLADVVVSGKYSAPGCQFIDMTYTRLKSLNIENANFIISDTKQCPENLNLTLITRPLDDIPPKQDYDPIVLPIVIGGTSINACYHWFFKDASSTMRRISTARGARIEKFMSNFEENKVIAMNRALYPQRKNPGINWNKNCVFGYTKIKFGFVNDCNIAIF